MKTLLVLGRTAGSVLALVSAGAFFASNLHDFLGISRLPDWCFSWAVGVGAGTALIYLWEVLDSTLRSRRGSDRRFLGQFRTKIFLSEEDPETSSYIEQRAGNTESTYVARKGAREMASTVDSASTSSHASYTSASPALEAHYADELRKWRWSHGRKYDAPSEVEIARGGVVWFGGGQEGHIPMLESMASLYAHEGHPFKEMVNDFGSGRRRLERFLMHAVLLAKVNLNFGCDVKNHVTDPFRPFVESTFLRAMKSGLFTRADVLGELPGSYERAVAALASEFVKARLSGTGKSYSLQMPILSHWKTKEQ